MQRVLETAVVEEPQPPIYSEDDTTVARTTLAVSLVMVEPFRLARNVGEVGSGLIALAEQKPTIRRRSATRKTRERSALEIRGSSSAT